jgi:hypothetical protein
MATIRDRGTEHLELAVAFNSLGTRGFLGIFCTFRRLLWMLDGPLLLILLHPSLVSDPLDAGSLLGFFCAFGRLLGMLRSLFAHGASFFPLKASEPPFSS